MKAIFIVYNQALSEKVEYMFDRLGIKGFTQWENVYGRGSVNGAPHMGTHTWPELNSSTLSIVEDEKVDAVLENVKKLDAINEEVGIRAFVWDVDQAV